MNRPEVVPVWQVLRHLRTLVEQDRFLGDLWVSGEVSNLTFAASGHIYFTLKDQSAALRCVFFRNKNMAQRDRLEEGGSLIVHGAATVYETRGDLQFVVDFVEAAGVGALAAEFERRKAQYQEEGLFAAERKRPLPHFPCRVGVVTSPTGAVFHDIQTVLARRWPLAVIRFMPCQVQGEEAAEDIADAIRAIAPQDAPETWPDVVIVGRGGGSAEDLWAFNEEPVVRAIFGCPVPVVSAVGHETDVALSDLVADVRAPTPSAAAEVVAPDRVEVARVIESMQHRQHVGLTRAAAARREAVGRAVRRVEYGLPDIARTRHHIAMHVDAMRSAVAVAVSRARESTATVESRLRALSPRSTLERGYTLVSTPAGAMVTSAAQAEPGERVVIQWWDGKRPARVESG